MIVSKSDKSSSPKECDCFIGFISGESVTKSTIWKEAKSLSNLQPIFKECGLMKSQPLSPKQILDNRRGYLSRFGYCPYCGEKVDWKKILSPLD